MLRSAVLPAGELVEALAPLESLRAEPPLESAGDIMVGLEEDMTEEDNEAMEVVMEAETEPLTALASFSLESLVVREKTPC